VNRGDRSRRNWGLLVRVKLRLPDHQQDGLGRQGCRGLLLLQRFERDQLWGRAEGCG
jgi:hypothetical protein